jgi:hypothetical protein
MLSRQKASRFRLGGSEKALDMQMDRARARMCDMPTMLMALSSVSTLRDRPNRALLAMRKSMVVSAGSLAMMLRTMGISAFSSFRVQISAHPASGITGNLIRCKNWAISGMAILFEAGSEEAIVAPLA